MTEVQIYGEWHTPEPDWEQVKTVLAELGIENVDVEHEQGQSGHGWGH